jgi:hypothetical protein
MSPRRQFNALLKEAWDNTPCDCPYCTPDHPDLQNCRIALVTWSKRCRRVRRFNEVAVELGLDPINYPIPPS